MNTDNSTVGGIDVMIVDIHGNLRGKTIPADQQDKVLAGAVRLPTSTLVQDVWGNDNDDLTGHALSIGDPDGLCIPEPRTLQSLPWRAQSSQILASMHNMDGTGYFADPRQILKGIIEQFTSRQLTPVVALELEFYLLDAAAYAQGIAKPPEGVLSAANPEQYMQLYDVRTMDRMQSVLTTIQSYAAQLNIPADACLAEFGPGQFEINLLHCNDGLKAADDAILFKRAIDCAARSCDMAATFMAKPYTEHCGNGMHVHVSVLDHDGNNIFAGNGGNASATLTAAVAGLLNSMQASHTLFAPNANSYRRLQPDNYAPVKLDWSHDHRGVAVRLPETSGPASRLEHRVAGADANPYLVLAAVLAGMLDGIDKADAPQLPPLAAGQESNGKLLTHDWLTSIENMASSEFINKYFGSEFQRVFTNIKRFEAQQFNKQVSNLDLQTYLTRV